jgi:hypothetical protein
VRERCSFQYLATCCTYRLYSIHISSLFNCESISPIDATFLCVKQTLLSSTRSAPEVEYDLASGRVVGPLPYLLVNALATAEQLFSLRPTA